jgi:hypothetical protein
VCLTEKQQMPILVCGLTQTRLKPTIFSPWGAHATHYTISSNVTCSRNDKAEKLALTNNNLLKNILVFIQGY